MHTCVLREKGRRICANARVIGFANSGNMRCSLGGVIHASTIKSSTTLGEIFFMLHLCN